MSRRVYVILFVFTIFMWVLSAAASDIYFAPTAAGSNNGTSCANAYAYNDSTHGWNTSSAEQAGNTLHICSGTYTASAGATLVNTVNSGTSSNFITLIADQGAATFQSPYFSSGGGVDLNNQYWIFNGDNNLTIQNTLNGSSGASCPGGACGNQQQSVGIYVNASANVTVENTTIGPVYVHSGNDTCCTTLYGIVGLGVNNLTISGNTFTYARVAIDAWGSNFLASSNTCTNDAACAWYGSGSATSNVVYSGNVMSNLSAWVTSGDNFHLEYIHLFTFNGALSKLQVYNNYFGSPQATCCQTAAVYLEGSYVSPAIFNNVFYNAKNGIDYIPAIEFETQTGGGGFSITAPVVVNNTFLGGGAISGSYSFSYDVGVSGLVWQNNVSTGNETLVTWGSSGFANGGVNYNAYENINSDSGSMQMFGYDGSNENSMSSWTGSLPSGSGQDSASILDTLSTLAINSPDGTLQSTSPARGLGTNLTSLGIAALNSDKNGVARPGSGAWDAGAYQFGSGSAPQPPTDLAAVVN